MIQKEKLEEAKMLYKDANADQRYVLEQLFPELAESEDEKIRKALIYHYQGDGCICTNEYRIDYKDIRAWLEKQANHANFCNKIQIGDKVTRNEDGVLVNLSQLNRVAKKQGEQKSFPRGLCKDSEDERIREWLINLVKSHIEWLEDRIKEQLSNGQVYGGELNEAKDAIAWLEKQGEQNNDRKNGVRKMTKS